MSAIDRAFIDAYGDEPEPSSRAAAAAAARADQNQSAATTVAPSRRPARRTASQAKRVAAAAAIQNAAPTPSSRKANDGAAATSPTASEASASETTASEATASEPMAAMAEQKSTAKMVVGRRALAQLAQSAAQTNLRARPNQPSQTCAIPAAMRVVDQSPLPETAEPVPFTPREQNLVKPPVLPLSGYRNATQTGQPVAASEVDRFDWPAVCDQLVNDESTKWEPVVAAIVEAMEKGTTVIAIASAAEGDGATTMALCLARMLAGERSVCLVDADFARPTLAESLGMAPEQEMTRLLSGEATLGDVLIESLEDELTVLPLTAPVAADLLERSKLRQTVMFGELREHFDLVLVDAGSIAAVASRQPSGWHVLNAGSGIDAVILVRSHQTKDEAWPQARKMAQQWSTPCLGIIENRWKVEHDNRQ